MFGHRLRIGVDAANGKLNERKNYMIICVNVWSGCVSDVVGTLRQTPVMSACKATYRFWWKGDFSRTGEQTMGKWDLFVGLAFGLLPKLKVGLIRFAMEAWTFYDPGVSIGATIIWRHFIKILCQEWLPNGSELLWILRLCASEFESRRQWR